MDWILLIATGLRSLLCEVPDVFLATDLLWYPIEGEPGINTAPDVMVTFGRPRGDRMCYKQWEEGCVAPQVVFEVLSPSNTYREMADKFAFYDDHGVEDYYVYDPEKNVLEVYLRGRSTLVRQRFQDQFHSPRLKVTFDRTGPVLAIFHPDGRRFLLPEEQELQRRKLFALTGKLLDGTASPEEVEELRRLQAGQ
jgi:Uma2 family endonuclease